MNEKYEADEEKEINDVIHYVSKLNKHYSAVKTECKVYGKYLYIILDDETQKNVCLFYTFNPLTENGKEEVIESYVNWYENHEMKKEGV